jgi:hypothetical protein
MNSPVKIPCDLVVGTSSGGCRDRWCDLVVGTSSGGCSDRWCDLVVGTSYGSLFQTSLTLIERIPARIPARIPDVPDYGGIPPESVKFKQS